MIISVRCVHCGWVDSTDAWEASDPPCCPMCSGDSAGELGPMVESGDDFETDREELYRYDD